MLCFLLNKLIYRYFITNPSASPL